MLSDIQKNLLEQIAQLKEFPEGAYNIRADGISASRNVTKNINIVSKADKAGIDIIIKEHTTNETVYIPVVLSRSGHIETVYNDFYIGEGADVTIIAGCGIHNSGDEKSEHSGIHTFYVAKNSKVKYVEKHYGEGVGTGENVMNPTTIVIMQENSFMEMETVQIKGVDSTNRVTKAVLNDGAILIIGEKILTHGNQNALTDFEVELNGENSSTHVVSRAVAQDNSYQAFLSNINGNNKCNGHTECDAIIMDNARVSAIPKIMANHVDATLIHEAIIGKIAGEQLMKLMTLGLDEKQAEEQIINGFLK